ncbi:MULTISPECIES: putative manganese transporter [Actibacterium]|uniref:10TM heavy-metal exporter n=1 Tax=Actibacterium naphthalenivorans TaxID=1614693 RepID=A0A840CEY8_9RHOB|nr:MULTISPECIES: putative manganese transporter [Actibacterium]MBB4020777.1 hypothetical protein [Actibacterium naphthalenivorans]
MSSTPQPHPDRAALVLPEYLGPFRVKRLILVLIYLALSFAPGRLGEVTRGLMTDAYTQVAVFVAATFLLFYGAERFFKFDMADALKGAKGWQVPVAALLGATPGCGGAVIVVAAYSSGNVGLGAMVATLTATMGDAAFLLLATRPDAAAVILPLSLVVGTLTGWIVDRFNKVTFAPSGDTCAVVAPIGRIRAKDWVYLMFILPGLVVGVAQLAQITIDDLLGIPVVWLAMAGITTGLLIWATSTVRAMTNPADTPVTRAAEETSFITIWVIAAYLAYDYASEFAGLDLEMWFQAVAPILPLIAIAVGFVPGCGPQVLVATLYVNGAIPFAALIGNAISNDGDALFPAIALNPKAAMLATVYSAVPALIVAYGFYLLAPGFMN